jgi:uncharacterized protein YegL
MKKVSQVHNLIILDESGSMNAIKDETLKGFEHLKGSIISAEAEFKKQKHKISLVTFNGEGVQYQLFNKPAVELHRFTKARYRPRSTTPLYDAICKSVLRLKHELSHKRNYRVLVTIITDGHENTSSEFIHSETKELISRLSDDSRWGFGFIGANINVDEVASSLAIPSRRTVAFDFCADGVGELFNRYGKAQYNMSKTFSRGGDFEFDDIPF